MEFPSFLKISRKLRRNWFFKTVRTWCKEITTDSASAEYRQWRHSFILKRLYMMTWVAIIAIAIGHLTDWIIPLTPLNFSTPKYDFLYLENPEVVRAIKIIGWIEILFTFVFFKISYVRQRPILIYLWIVWTLLVSQQFMLMMFLGIISVEGYGWIVVLSAGAILMPVRWQWHCLCQIFFWGFLTISSLIFGLYDPFIGGIEYFDAVYFTVIVCFIVNYAVFLYERFLQQEFELRRQLRLFLHTVSHDLRNPVLGIMFLLKSLRDNSTEETIVKNEILDQIIASSDRQLQLIDSLLEVHKTETKGIALLPRPICINNLVRSVIQDLQPFLDRQQATVTNKISTRLPLVNIDPLQIRRVYENLITNALEYNQPGLHLTVECGYPQALALKARERMTLSVEDNSLPHKQRQASPNHWICCTISDNGIGISLKQQSYIFDLYTRGAGNKQSLNVGLGLYICRQIINAHGGEIGVNSNDRGVSFWFTLPIA